MKLTVNVPATTANLGPGFDCLGLGLDIWNTIVVEPADGALEVRVRGADESLPRNADNVTVQAMAELFQELDKPFPNLRVTMTNRIPIGRGFGSSAAAIVGGLVAANEWYGGKLPKEQLLVLASRIEGHPDNVSAALYGGLTIVVSVDGAPIVARMDPPRGWRAVLFVPAQTLSTKFARKVLPRRVTRADAVFNIGRAALLIHAFAENDAKELQIATADRLHQPYREALVPGMRELLEAATDAGACGAALSGAGPSLIAFAENRASAQRIARAFQRRASTLRLKGETRIARLSARGAYAIRQ